ncbi:MAG: hypothetical protein J6Q60_08110 [Bacteroidaceae bacterium]|nr:hypothetical protein [Bacteroidaceae bacterium]
MDNTCYFLGDTIYYKAYVRRGDTGTPSRLSGVLYAELLNQDGYLVERQQLELRNGQVHGSFVLPDTLYGGYYELRAYTRWQLNWGITEHPHNKVSEQWFFNKRMAKEFYRDYEKLYSRVFPVFDKPDVPGDFYHEMTLRPLRRQSKIDETSPKPKLQLFPEGGNLVAGVPNRIAFEATSNEGLHLDGKVTVADGSGNVVAEADVEQRGRGSFVFTPQSGKTYSVTYAGKKGTAKEKLPSPDVDGVALQVQNNGVRNRTVELRMAGAAASEPLGMTVMHNGVMLDFQTVPAGTSATLTLDEAKLKTGVCQVTIYNNVGRVYADRLFFCRKDDFAPSNLRFGGLGKQPAEPFALVSFAVEGGSPGATVSVSVCDATHSEYLYDNGNILTEMLLSSEIRGFVENPGYFFEKDNDEHRRALDLLLMIQGWRRYDWHTMTMPGAFVLNHKPEQTPLFVGEVNSYMASEQESLFADNFQSVSAGSATFESVSVTGEQQVATNMDSDTKEAEDGGSVTASRQLTETTGPEVTTPRDELARFSQGEKSLKHELLVRARFAKPGAEQGIDGEMLTDRHTFSIPSPRFYEGCIFHLAASDSTKWKKGKSHVWEYPSTDRNDKLNYPEFYVRLRPFFPRFVKPYNWYQCHLAPAPKGSAISQEWVMDGSRLLDEVTVRVKRARLGRFDPTKPAYVIDAYEAFNEVCDAGFCPGIYYGYNRFVRDISRTYIGDMNLSRDYVLEHRLDGKKESNKSVSEMNRTTIGGATSGGMPIETFNISSQTKEKYNLLKNLGKVYIYTDYSPRREGNSLYDGEDIPTVSVSLHLIDNNDTHRSTSRDRRYILPGFSAPEEFYQPDYSNKPLPEVKDYRRTLYWNPDLKLDENGRAEIRFYGNGRQTYLGVSAEGLANDGTLLTGKSMPEDR